MKTITTQITKAHFDKATAVPWSTTTCIVAQALAEATGKAVHACSRASACIGENEIVILDFDTSLQRAFDDGHENGIKHQLDRVERQLPTPLLIHIP